MSYPRNAASPPVYDVGSLVQISDGALQTSGASARVKIGTGSWGAAAGSLDCDATSGIWTYTPSQAETDAESFIVAVYKTGAVSISRTVVPSASTVAGRTMPADGSITAAVIADNAIDAGAIAANAITAAKIADGAIDTATFASGTTLPRVTLVDTCTTNSDMRGTDNAALAATALSTATWTSTIAGRIDVAVSSRLAPLVAGRAIAVSETTGKVTAEAVELDSAVATQIDNIENASGYLLAVLAGECADPQTASETYAITVFGSTFTVDMAGQTSTGTRTAPTLTKT